MNERKIKIFLIALTVILIGAVLGALYAVNRQKTAESLPTQVQESEEKKQEKKNQLEEKTSDKDAQNVLNIRAGENSGVVPVSDEEAKKSLSVPAPANQRTILSDDEVKNALTAK